MRLTTDIIDDKPVASITVEDAARWMLRADKIFVRFMKMPKRKLPFGVFDEQSLRDIAAMTNALADRIATKR